ncbi:hypothetical protein Bca52824_002716 [Brassica carinata]|uniref:TIR domain-containing protein n=1 Tax=Brassica carinata TaxID=52824 RepID=A0A8X7WL81_BRACI|nr:hypothetical protein Bca52824_002716 [Brassica carinata]
MGIFLQRIAESRIVLVILSPKFMESDWCIDEVLKALDTREAGTSIIPVFYKVSVADVKGWSIVKEGNRDKFINVTKRLGLRSKDYPTSEADFVNKIVEELEKALTKLETEEEENKLKIKQQPAITTMPFFGINKRVRQLQEKLMMGVPTHTRLVGVVGMKGSGKTKLSEMFFEEGKCYFLRHMFFKDKIGKNMESDKKRDLLVQQFQKNLLKISKTEEKMNSKLLLVLDDFSDKEDIRCLFGDRGWITPGSKIVIVASDKSLVKGLVDDTYVVPSLNEKEGLACLSYHAFGDATRCDSYEGNLWTLSRKFLDYARGNPLALSSLGKELYGRGGNGQWVTIHEHDEALTNKNIQHLFKSCYDCLNRPQKEAFLDVACFFISQDHTFVKTVVDSSCGDGTSVIKDLADKFLIEITSGRVEMHGLLYTLGKNLASQNQWRLLNQQDIIQALEKKLDFAGAVRGIFLDMSEVSVARASGQKPFHGMKELRYLKLYTSCTRFPELDSKLNFPEGLEFSLEEVRYFHWHKFPLKELPEDFTPKNLIDLKLPYSNIIRLWDSSNDVPNLRWVDLSHSINLQDLSGLSGAENLQRLNLEGCTGLKELPKEIMVTMTSLLYLNLRSCTSLISLSEITIKSLKTLILSNCSNLEKFQMILENIEALHLDGTASKELPESIKERKKLVILSLRGCTKLASVPDSLGKLHDLEELILSGCSNLKSFPDVKENMKKLRILLLDGTAINQVPQVFPSASGTNFLSSLQRLCLSGNLVIQTLQAHIGQLYHLNFLDLQDCKNLTSIPVLPPNLHCLNAHGCNSLTTVANPLAFLNLKGQIHTTLIFSQCNNMDEVSKSYIISYIHKRSQLMSSAFNRYSLSYVMESYTGACFPGCEVPEWFRYQGYGSMVETELRRQETENRIIGLDLCAVVSFQNCQDQISGFHVKCTCDSRTRMVL